MTDKTEKSNLNNNTSDTDTDNIPEASTGTENKSSSTLHPESLKSNTQSDSENTEVSRPEELQTDQAIDDVVRQEGDEVLAAEDSELAKAFVPVKLPWYKKIFAKKKIWIPLTILIILLVLAAVPFSRYKILGLVWKQNIPLVILDAQTHQPVSRATIVLRNVQGLTDSDGKLTLRVPVGNATVTISKHYYKTTQQKLLVPLHDPHTSTITLMATGRQVPLQVIDEISHQPIANATVVADKTSVRTNEKGTAVIVLPANKSSAVGQITTPSSAYNQAAVTIKISSNPGSTNTFQLTPSGKVYFLSNASGKIDVVSTNIDGSDRQTILAGTGNESPTATQFSHSADWKYLALLTTRTSNSSDNGTLYYINPTTGQISTIQSGIQTYISIIGWSADDHLIYTASSATLGSWQSGGELLESYNPATGKSTLLDQTTAEGTSSSDYAAQSIENEFILPNNTVLYTKRWTSSYPTTSVSSSDKQMGIYTINTNGTGIQAIKTFPTDFTTYLSVIENTPDDYYIAQQNIPIPAYYEFIDKTLRVAPSSVNAQTFNNYFSAATTVYYLSPDATSTVWSALHDGNSVIYRGDSNANNPSQIATLNSMYGVAGWFTNNYVLVEKNYSELYIMPKTGLTSNLQPLKITDYFTSSGGH
ncbi:MAG TPA: carboxypeptidase-like regulatory domain-containing protein [Candidatus Saccharimonadales bacterium]|nr:carboxypeptidase-like regulatory domain-containing protein [Candidatus Saccharimonadales bacterium]